MAQNTSGLLLEAAPDISRILNRNGLETSPTFGVSEIQCETLMVAMRDGVRLATDLYLPPRLPAPAVAIRTPYGRGYDKYVGFFMSLARRGYAVISQDCRGTGGSEPDGWDYYMYEPEDGHDFVEWVSQQAWFDGFLGSFGSSYVGQTQWHMSMHPRMSAIAPHVSGLGVVVKSTLRMHMFHNAYARSVGKGEGKVAVSYVDLEAQMLGETLSTGRFNEPVHKPFSPALLAHYPILRELSSSEAKQWLWEHYCGLSGANRAKLVKLATGAINVTSAVVETLPAIFGHRISHDAHTLPHPNPSALVKSLHAPALMVTGWYDWYLNDALATWQLLRRAGSESLSSRSRLLITPHAHHVQGYHEGTENHPELREAPGPNVELLLKWYQAIREGNTDGWPRVIYYLMGANEWRIASEWPVPEAIPQTLYLGSRGTLTSQSPASHSQPDLFTYDPQDPTPTVGGSIVSFVYPPGSVDVSEVQERSDVLVYTTPPLDRDLDVVGPLRVVLYVSSSAVDTDFTARLSDVFPDGRAIQLQNGALRTRYRNFEGEPELMVPGEIYKLEIDLWATANRFKAGHRLRVDIASADFPKFNCNTNLGGEQGDPIPARQAVYRDPDHPSHIIFSVLNLS